ncbi:hypothetical protein PAEPH01_0221 [Pancytospora epiphaga]|nr:hypothetical protein PAEPH01_0221 [Pancytospora epiphaga]
MSRELCLNDTCFTHKEETPIHRHIQYRRTLLRWLYEVCQDFRYNSQTYTIAARLVDSYTSKKGLDPKKYQLVGIACLFLAAKIEETKTFRVDDYVAVTDGSVTMKEIIDKEKEIILMGSYDVCISMPHNYLPYLWDNVVLDRRDDIMMIFPGVLATVIERSFKLNNPKLLCLRAIEEINRIIKTGSIDEDVKVYLKVDRTYKQIMRVHHKDIKQPQAT